MPRIEWIVIALLYVISIVVAYELNKRVARAHGDMTPVEFAKSSFIHGLMMVVMLLVPGLNVAAPCMVWWEMRDLRRKGHAAE